MGYRHYSNGNGMKATAIVASALLISASIALPMQSAYAVDETRTFTWKNGQNRPQIPDTIQSNGKTLHISSQSEPSKSNGSGSVSQHFDRSANYTVGADHGNDIAGATPSSMHIDENGFVGDIPRTSVDSNPVYGNSTKHQTINRDFQVMANNTSALPSTVIDGGRTYSLENATFDESYRDSSGTVYIWTAHATYGTDITENGVIDHYDVTAHYSGDISKSVDNGEWSMTVTYHADDDEQNQNDDEQENDNQNGDNTNEEQQNEEENNDTDGNEENSEYANDEYPYDEYEDSSVNNEDLSNSNSNSDDDDNGVPILPTALGIGALAIAGIIIATLARRKKKNNGDDENAIIEDTGTGTDTTSVLDEEPKCQLIEVTPIYAYDENGNELEDEDDYEQSVIANLEIDPSLSNDIPNIIYMPPMEDEEGNKIELEASKGSQYWIVVDESMPQHVESKDYIVATDSEHEITRGSFVDDDGELDNQFQMDAERLFGALSSDETDDDYDEKYPDISDELDDYSLRSAAIATSYDDENDEDDLNENEETGSSLDYETFFADDDDNSYAEEDDLATYGTNSADSIDDEASSYDQDDGDISADYDDLMSSNDEDDLAAPYDHEEDDYWNDNEVNSATRAQAEDDIDDFAELLESVDSDDDSDDLANIDEK